MQVRRAWFVAVVLALVVCGAVHAQAQPAAIVFGQSLPLSGPGFPIANRVLAGARALVERVNAGGGVQGRKVELVTLDDQGDPRRTADNVRTLVRQHGVMAVVNCLGEQACIAAAEASRGLGVLLVGPLSGAAALRAPALRHVFTLRPDDRREAQALLGQLQAIGSTRVALLGDGYEPAREQVIAAVLQAGGIELQRLRSDGVTVTVEAALRTAARAAPQALVLNLGPDSLDVLSRAEPALFEGLPAFVASLSTPGLTQLTRLLRRQAIAFTSVLPNPEISQLLLVREFERDVDAHGGPEAISFEGFAAYLHLRVCLEALRRTGTRSDGTPLARAIENLGDTHLGGFALRFGPERHHGSDFVEIGLRSRDGRLRR